VSALQAPSRSPLAAGDRVLVTGANGFIGSSVARTLVAEGCSVVAMIEPKRSATNVSASDPSAKNLIGLDVDFVECDLRDRARVHEVVRGCRAIFHVAAIYRFWAEDPKIFYDVNVGGTRNVLDAAAASSVERVVYTSTVGTLGVHGSTGSKGVDETSYPDLAHLFGSYKRSKYVGEHEVLRAAATGLPVNIVMPTFPLGPGDSGPTPTGKVVLDFINGKLPGYVDTILNVVHVDDVGRGHLLAFNRGGQGRSYILGGENLSMKELLDVLAGLTGQRSPSLRVPARVARCFAWISENVEGRILGRRPTVPLEAARMSSTKMAFDDSRARAELGYTSRPPAQAIEASARWFVDNGYSVRHLALPILG
jgi:dihydroflavonol-4-reductase